VTATTTTTKRRRGVGYDLHHHLAKISDATQALFETLRDQITALGEDVTAVYESVRGLLEAKKLRGDCRAEAQAQPFHRRPSRRPEGLTEDVSNIGHWGTGNLRVSVTSDDDIDRVIPCARLRSAADPKAVS
jgi:predicted transport protein